MQTYSDRSKGYGKGYRREGGRPRGGANPVLPIVREVATKIKSKDIHGLTLLLLEKERELRELVDLSKSQIVTYYNTIKGFLEEENFKRGIMKAAIQTAYLASRSPGKKFYKNMLWLLRDILSGDPNQEEMKKRLDLYLDFVGALISYTGQKEKRGGEEE